jgi:hypothetical protein
MSKRAPASARLQTLTRALLAGRLDLAERALAGITAHLGELVGAKRLPAALTEGLAWGVPYLKGIGETPDVAVVGVKPWPRQKAVWHAPVNQAQGLDVWKWMVAHHAPWADGFHRDRLLLDAVKADRFDMAEWLLTQGAQTVPLPDSPVPPLLSRLFSHHTSPMTRPQAVWALAHTPPLPAVADGGPDLLRTLIQAGYPDDTWVWMADRLIERGAEVTRFVPHPVGALHSPTPREAPTPREGEVMEGNLLHVLAHTANDPAKTAAFADGAGQAAFVALWGRLEQAGVSPNQKNEDGLSPLDIWKASPLNGIRLALEHRTAILTQAPAPSVRRPSMRRG